MSRKRPWLTVAIDGTLDRGEELRNPLDLVQRDPAGQGFHEAPRIQGGGTDGRVIVEADVGAVTREAPDERGLAALPGAR